MLSAFNEGLIRQVEEIDRIAEHLATCDNCIDELERMEPSPLAIGLRQSKTIFNDEESDDLNSGSTEKFHQAMDRARARDQPWIGDRSIQNHAEQRYQILGLLGNGNFGSTFLVRIESGELFALKIPHAGSLSSAIHYQQFLDDCKNALSLEHPRILTIVDHGNWDAQNLFYAMPLVESRSTLTALGKRAISDESAKLKSNQAVSIFEQVIDTIKFAHNKSVLHRHLSSDHIWIDNDFQVQISDFGFVLDSRYHFEIVEPLTTVNPFLSPETINNDANFVDHRSDIYSMGRILKMLLSISEKLEPECESLMREMIETSTQPRRRERFQSLGEFCDAWQNASKTFS